MAATKVGIVYSVAQRKRRMLVIPDSDAELPLSTQPGEGYVEQSMADFRQRGPDAAVQDATGGPPLSDRCALVDGNGTVVNTIVGDPAITPVWAGHTPILSTIAMAGDTFQAGVFMRRFALADAAGLVTQIVTADATKPPAPPLNGQAVSSMTLKAGDLIPAVVSAVTGATVL